MSLEKRLLGNRLVQTVVGWMLGSYARLVYNTARITIDPPQAFDTARAEGAAIFVFWHGMALLALGMRPLDMTTLVMVSRHGGAAIAARAIELQGFGTIRASGAHRSSAALRKGGATGFLKALGELEAGPSILMTADVPKVAEVAGRGVLLLAKASGRPVIAAAYASRWSFRLKTWDRLVVNLPFSRTAIVHGEAIHVPPDADDAMIETLRIRLSSELDRVNKRAYELCGKHDASRSNPAAHG